MNASATLHSPLPSTLRQAAAVFLAFAFAYFLSALLRAVTATLADGQRRKMLLGGAQEAG